MFSMKRAPVKSKRDEIGGPSGMGRANLFPPALNELLFGMAMGVQISGCENQDE
jgi:hypothetical protein